MPSMTESVPDDEAPTGAWAALLIDAGYAVCRPDPSEKKPTYRGWSTRSLAPDDFAPGDMLGILGGPLSNGDRPGHALVVLDLDSPEAVALADEYLPPTWMMEGREGKPNSHRYFLVPLAGIPKWACSTAEQGAKAAVEKCGHPGPFLKSFAHRETGKEVIRFIGSGGQVVCPPSVWASADGTRTERRVWHGGEPGEAAVVGFLDLWRAVCELASECGAEIPDVIPRPPAPARPRSTQSDTDLVKRALAYVAKMRAAVAGQGGHKAAFAVARALTYGFDLGVTVSLDLMMTHYNPRCVPEWSEAELRHKVQDADRCPFDKPRGWLRDAARPEKQSRPALRPYNPPEAVSMCEDEATGDTPVEPVPEGDHGDGAGTARVRGWGQPAPLPEMPDVPPFPLDAFPAPVREYWRAAGAALSCPVDYVAVPGISLLGAAAGRARATGVKPGYYELPAIWTAVIAPPGSTKSSALQKAGAPLYGAEARWLEEQREKLSVFDTEAERHNAAMREWKAGGCEGEPPTKPAKPTLRQALLDDTTAEAAAKVLAENPRGICLVKDELMGFIRSMNQYRSGGKGADLEFWLAAWAGKRAKVNRAKDHDAGPLIIPEPFVGVTGMMTPDAIKEFRGESRDGESQANGFVDRFCLSFPDPFDAEGETWQTVPEELEQGYCDVVLHLLGMELVPVVNGPEVVRHRPYVVPLSDRARVAWEEFTGTIAHKINALDKMDPFRGVLAKLKGYAARFAALLWSLRRAAGEADANSSIGADTLADAASIVDYFEKHAERCHGVGWADRTSRVARRLIRWMQRHPGTQGFSRTEVFNALKDKKDVRNSASLAPVFTKLADFNYIRLISGNPGKPGPDPEYYTINPDWQREGVPSCPVNPCSSTPVRQTAA